MLSANLLFLMKGNILYTCINGWCLKQDISGKFSQVEAYAWGQASPEGSKLLNLAELNQKYFKIVKRTRFLFYFFHFIDRFELSSHYIESFSGKLATAERPC